MYTTGLLTSGPPSVKCGVFSYFFLESMTTLNVNHVQPAYVES